MRSTLEACSLELVKVAKDSNRSYLGQAALLAPAAAVGSAADFPKGWIEKSVERRVGGGKIKLPKVRAGKTWHRGVARVGGKLPANVLTLPMFISGIKDLKEGDTSKGMAKVVGSGAVYSGLKGRIEGSIEKALTPEGVGRAALRSPKAMGRVRAALGALTAVSTAGAIAKTRKGKKKGKDQSVLKQLALPTAVGTVGGGLKGGIEEAYDQYLKKIKSPKRIKGAIAGRAAAGALGAVALSHIADWAMKKTSADQEGILPHAQAMPVNANVMNALESTPAPFRKVDLGPKPGELYYQTLGWAHGQPGLKVQTAFNKLHTVGDPERSPSSRAVYYALHDDLSERGKKLPAPRMRDQVNPPVTNAPGLIEAGALAAVVMAPVLVWQQLSSRVSTADKDMVLRDALDRMAAAKGVYVDEMSHSNWESGVQKALNDYRASNKRVLDSMYLNRWPKAHGKPYPGPLGGTVGAETMIRNVSGDIISHKSEVPWIAIEKHQKPSIIAHEIGHATGGAVQKALRSPLANKAYGAGRFASIVLPLLALSAGHDSSFTTSRELEARANVASAIGKISLVAAAPKLTEEAIASVKALKYLARAEAHSSPELAGKSMHALKGTLAGRALGRGIRTLLPAFGTYAAPFAIPFLAAKYLRDKAEKARRAEVTQRRR